MKSKRLTVVAVILLTAAIVVAATPCRWIQIARYVPGGTCSMNENNAVCSDPYISQQGDCYGSNNTRICAEGIVTYDFDRYYPRVANSCDGPNPCALSAQKLQLTYNAAWDAGPCNLTPTN